MASQGSKLFPLDGSKDWMDLSHYGTDYIEGVERFLEFAFTVRDPQGKEIQCPCAKCCNIHWRGRNVVKDHLIANGFVKGYTRWINHGELIIPMDVDQDMEDGINCDDDIDGLLHDRFRDVAQEGGENKGPNDDAKKFYKLIDEASQELYPGCKRFSKLLFTIRLYLLKCLHGSRKAYFTSLLELLKEAMLDLNISASLGKTKTMMKDLGLDYEKIDACHNDCMLYRGEYINEIFCYVCGASQYNEYSIMDNDPVPSKKSHKIVVRSLRHFPLIPRLQRLFMCSRIANTLRWHDEERSKDGNMRHPVDGQSWKNFDNCYPDFAKDSRNLRLGLASDGFNPFRTMSISHSTWLVVLMVYNLPPWMSMKSEYCMLSLLIPGPRSPGNDIDVYMQPLVEELMSYGSLV